MFRSFIAKRRRRETDAWVPALHRAAVSFTPEPEQWECDEWEKRSSSDGTTTHTGNPSGGLGATTQHHQFGNQLPCHPSETDHQLDHQQTPPMASTSSVNSGSGLDVLAATASNERRLSSMRAADLQHQQQRSRSRQTAAANDGGYESSSQAGETKKAEGQRRKGKWTVS